MIRKLLAAALLAALPALAAAEPPKPLLWKVADADNEIYLLGSFHMLRPEDYPLAKSVDVAFEDAESLAFELSPTEMADPALGQMMAQAARRDDGKTLQQSLPADTWAKLEAHAAKRGMALANLQGFEAWFVGLMVSMGEMQRVGLNPTLGLDRHMMERAAKAGKAAIGLETGAEQIALFDEMSQEEQVQSLLDTLDELQDFEKEINELHALWRAGDGEAIHARMAEEMREKYPRLYKRINADRNLAWLPRLQAMLARSGDDQDVLVVVGAVHLLGEEGLVELLRAKGYTITRL